MKGDNMYPEKEEAEAQGLYLPVLYHPYGSWITQNIYNKEKNKTIATQRHR